MCNKFKRVGGFNIRGREESGYHSPGGLMDGLVPPGNAGAHGVERSIRAPVPVTADEL